MRISKNGSNNDTKKGTTNDIKNDTKNDTKYPPKTKSSITTPPAGRGVVGCASHFVGIFYIIWGSIVGTICGTIVGTIIDTFYEKQVSNFFCYSHLWDRECTCFN